MITHTAQPVSTKKQYPSTGEKVATYGFAGLLLVAGSAGTWVWYNRRKAS
ncbi:LPXTG cell wall anchor domain-containing protein [Enterococcus pallens]